MAATSAARRSSSAEVRRRHPAGAGDDVVQTADVDLERAAVEVEQRPPGGRVGQFERHRLVDPAGTRCQRRLQRVGPVRREDEDDVGVLGQPVHLVEQLEQQRVLPRVHAAVLRDEQRDPVLLTPRKLGASRGTGPGR
nr:hypothetical protein [Blastococcus atacamensis]